MARCFICGRYASNRMKCGEYICGDHTNALGGLLNWHNIRKMTPEQVFYVLGIDDNEDDKMQNPTQVYTPSAQDKALRRGMMSKSTNERQTIIVKQSGGCMAAIGWFVVIVFVILPLLNWLIGIRLF